MEKILTYMNNDRKQNLSVVSSFSHFVELFLIWCLKQYEKKLRLACKAGAWKLYGREKD